MIPNQLKMTVGLGLKHQTPKFQPSHFSVPARMSECKVLHSAPGTWLQWPHHWQS